MKRLPYNYIAGLLDADGSFNISVTDKRNPNQKTNPVTFGFTVFIAQLSRYHMRTKILDFPA